jgi:lipoprotein-anchoring transpeptidase ErfK/SrfK
MRFAAGMFAAIAAGMVAAGNACAHPRVAITSSSVARVHAGTHVVLYKRRGGAPIGMVGGSTEFGSPMMLGIVGRRGHWLAVRSSELRNTQVAWIRLSAVSTAELHTTIAIDLSRRQLVVRRRGRIVQRAQVGIGAPSTPTPIGVFTVTDKLDGRRFSAAYGCCILPLSAHQPRLPAGWRGGDRIAIHGTNDPSTIGRAASAGCVHVRESALRVLMRTVPLGTTVAIVP